MPTEQINSLLMDVAAWRTAGSAEKKAFVPTGGDPAAGGAPPMDPAAAGGAPPMDPAMAGGAPPMDPAMAGAPPMDPAMAGAPPMDPAMAGGAPPMDPMIQQIVDQAVQAAMGAAGGGGGGAAGPGAGPGGKAKVDPGLLYMELGRLRKLMTTMYQNLGWDLPPDILDDSQVAQSVMGDPASQPMDQAGAAPPAEDPAAASAGLPGIGTSPAINPIEPAAVGKQASIRDIMTGNSGTSGGFDNPNMQVDAVAALARSLARQKA